MSEPVDLQTLLRALADFTTRITEQQAQAITQQERFQSEIRQEFAEVRQEFAEVRQEFAEVRQEFAEVRQQGARTTSLLCAVLERDLRKSIGQSQGVGFAKELHLLGLEGLAKVIQEADSEADSASHILSAAVKLAEALIASRIPDRYLRRLHGLIASSTGPDPGLKQLKDALAASAWQDPLNPAQLAAFLRELQAQAQEPAGPGGVSAVGYSTNSTPVTNHRPLVQLLFKLLAYLRASDQEVKKEQLLTVGVDGSLGLAMSVYAATMADTDSQPLPALVRYRDLPLLTTRVQFDVQGFIKLLEVRAVTEAGEIMRTDASYDEAKAQLRQRLNLLKWAIKILRPSINDFLEIGHIYFPAGFEPMQREGSETDTDGTCYYTHYV